MKKKMYIYFYYAVLLVIFAMRQTVDAEPAMAMRLLFMAAVFMPTFIIKGLSYPAILTMFLSLTTTGMSFSYLPYTLSLYALITIMAFCFFRFFRSKNIKIRRIPIILVVFTFYVFIIDFVTGIVKVQPDSSIFEYNFYCLVMICFFIAIIGRDKEMNLNQLSICYSVITIVLCVLFLTIGKQSYTQSYFSTTEERTMWTDPNYFGMAVAMGTVLGLIKLFSKERKSLLIVEKAIYISAIVVSIPVLVLNASRGAIVSVLVAFVVFVIISRTKLLYKGVLVVVAMFTIYYLYRNQYFDLLAVRIEYDDSVGSGRTEIWANKLKEYSQGNIIQMLFGVGRTAGANLGGRGQAIGFHNDILGHLVDYGVVGVFLLLYLLYYPIKITPKDSYSKPYIVVIIVYLVSCFMTLEPFVTGILSYYVFYMYALLLAQKERDEVTSVS